MITFKQFLTEEKFDIEKFKIDCAPFLKESKGNILYHGTANTVYGYEITQWKEREKPTNSPKVLHDKLNELFKKMFGYPIRNWLFTTGNLETSWLYSGSINRYISTAIFPIGEYEYVYASDKDAEDLYTMYSSYLTDVSIKNATMPRSEKDIAATNLLLKKVPHLHWKFNEDLISGIKSGNEVMIKCNKFYQFNTTDDEYKKVREYLKTL
jgi:hypothetical protein